MTTLDQSSSDGVRLSVSWDQPSDDEQPLVDLPSEVTIPADVWQAAAGDPELITDYLSDTYGFLVSGFAPL